MKELDKKSEDFCRLWVKQREKKWFYVFVHGSIYWGLPSAIFTFLLSSHFEIGKMSIYDLLISLIVFMIVGLGYGLSQYKRINNIYLGLINLGLNHDNEIKKGIHTIETGNNWNYENLIINKEIDETLTIQNQLFWYEEKDIASKKIEECFNLVYEDYQRLKKNKDFDQFISNRKVRIQLMDNSVKKNLLMEKFI